MFTRPGTISYQQNLGVPLLKANDLSDVASTSEARDNLDLGSPLEVEWYGAVADGATDDSAAIASAFAVGDPVFFRGGTYYVNTALLLPHGKCSGGPKATILCGPSGSITIAGGEVIMHGLTFSGPMSTDQYEVAVTGAQISTAFDSPTYEQQTGTGAISDYPSPASDFTHTKVGAVLTMNLKGLTGGVSRYVTSAFITLNVNSRYVLHVLSQFASAYSNFYQVEFLCYNSGGAYLSSYDPSDSSTYFSLIYSTAKIKIRLGLRRYVDMPTPNATALNSVINLDSMEILKLKNDLASFSLVDPNLPGLLLISGSTNPVVRNCTFLNHPGTALGFVSCYNVLAINNVARFVWAGIGAYLCTKVTAIGNVIDLRQRLTGSSVPLNLKPLRLKCISATSGSDISISGNTLVGGSWGVEVYSCTGKNTFSNNPLIEAEYCGISCPSNSDVTASGNIIELQGGVVFAGIEAEGAAVVSRNSIVDKFSMSGQNIGIASGGQASGGNISSGSITGNDIEAPSGIVMANGGDYGPSINGNRIIFKAVGIYSQVANLQAQGNSIKCVDSMTGFSEPATISVSAGSGKQLVAGNELETRASFLVFNSGGSESNIILSSNNVSLKSVLPFVINIQGFGSHVYENNTFTGSTPAAWIQVTGSGFFPSSNNRFGGVPILLGTDLSLAGECVFVTTTTANGTHVTNITLPNMGQFEIAVSSHVGSAYDNAINSRWTVTASNGSNAIAATEQIGSSQKTGGAIMSGASAAFATTATGYMTYQLTSVGGGSITMTHSFTVKRLNNVS